MKLAILILGLAAAVLVKDHSGEYQHLQWLLGSWQFDNGKNVFTENWSRAGEDLFLGNNFTLRGSDTVFYENVRLEILRDTLCYNVTPKGAATPTAFRLASLTTDKAVFENPTHDFPQRITYHHIAPDSLHAFVEGPGKKGWKVIDYHYHRTK